MVPSSPTISSTRPIHYVQSLADPCVFYSLRKTADGGQRFGGVIAVATDDLLHGGDEVHLQQMARIQKKYKLGKYQFGQGRFTGKNLATQPDGSVTVNQEHYTREKLIMINIERSRKKRRYSHCTEEEISNLRASVGALSWLAKQSRPDLAGKVALLQQSFPRPRVRDLIEANSITAEAQKTPESGVRIMPITPENLQLQRMHHGPIHPRRTSWKMIEEITGRRLQCYISLDSTHHQAPRKLLFHPGATQGPDLHDLLPRRKTVADDGRTMDDQWTHGNATTSSWSPTTWTGKTYFAKQPAGQNLTTEGSMRPS